MLLTFLAGLAVVPEVPALSCTSPPVKPAG